MDSHVWAKVYSTVRSVNRSIPREGRRKTYSDVLIAGMYLWSAWHDRPMRWACERSSYTSLFRPRALPSVSQFCKRVKSARVQLLLQRTFDRLAETDRQTATCFVDARPLPVGPCSKDQDARPGHVYGGFARGYKLHAIVTANGRTLSWAVTSLPVSEAKAAQAMVAEAKPRGLLVADASYDRAPLYEAVAEHGGRLLAVPLKGAGQGHRKQSEERLSSLFLWRRIGPVMRRKRVRIECSFGNQSMYGGGLGPLPAWVRTLERVRRWVGAKLIIHHARLAVKRAAA
jgi:hypothetical protein